MALYQHNKDGYNTLKEYTARISDIFGERQTAIELFSRPAAHDDFMPFFSACYRDASVDWRLREIIEREWHLLLDSPATLSLVVEDRQRPANSRLIGCAQLGFVTKGFMRLTHDAPEPWVNARVARPLPSGASPLLAPCQIAHANATTGLSALFTRWHRADRLLTVEGLLETGLFLHDAFQAYSRGYQFRELLVEATGASARDQALRAGFSLRCDYEAFYREIPPLPPLTLRPYLMGVTREEALLKDGCLMSYYFVHRKPRLDLTTSQQELLQLCLRKPDLSEGGLAEELGVPLHRVKNLLKAAYQRTACTSVDLLPDVGEHGRGQEKKRRLLLYLSKHPEELRPYQRRGVAEDSGK